MPKEMTKNLLFHRSKLAVVARNEGRNLFKNIEQFWRPTSCAVLDPSDRTYWSIRRKRSWSVVWSQHYCSSVKVGNKTKKYKKWITTTFKFSYKLFKNVFCFTLQKISSLWWLGFDYNSRCIRQRTDYKRCL